jgi:hypothetical protein
VSSEHSEGDFKEPAMSAISDPADSDIAEHRRADYYREMDRRLIILETRFDTVLPTLATKADLAELKGALKGDVATLRTEMHSLFGSMHKWIAATCVALLLGFGGLSITMLNIVNSLPRVIAQATQGAPAR